MTDRHDELNDDPFDPPERARDEGSFTQRVIPDLVRRALMTGVGTVLLGQEGVRAALSDMKLPKEAMEYLVQQAERTKREVINSLARELRQFLDTLELQELIQRALVGTTFEIHTTIRIVENEGGGVKMKVMERTSRIERDEPEADDAESQATHARSSKKTASKKKRSAKKMRKSAE